MVDPVSQAERDSFTRKLKVGVAALVAASTGMVALGAGASLPQAAVALLVGVVVGVVIALYVVPDWPSPATRRGTDRSRLDDPFADGGETESTDAGRDGADGREPARSSDGRRREK